MNAGFAMRLRESGTALVKECITPAALERHQVRLQVLACGVCRTDLHLLDGELPQAHYPITPGHEIVGRVIERGADVTEFAVGDRVGVPWLASTCGSCSYCRQGMENLCDFAAFTGCTVDGGYAQTTVADAQFCLAIPARYTDAQAAPLLCAGLIGYRAYRAAGDGQNLGLYGFGAAAHLLAQIAHKQGRHVFAFVRPGDTAAKRFALELGVRWAGGSDEMPPEALDAAILFAPAGELVPTALQATRKGGRVVCAGIHMSDIPSFPYRFLWGERSISSVANLTRMDGRDFMRLAADIDLHPTVEVFALEEANEALARLRGGRLQGAAVLAPS
jgi:propanol-preferring alcohol dehydrogenase